MAEHKPPFERIDTDEVRIKNAQKIADWSKEDALGDGLRRVSEIDMVRNDADEAEQMRDFQKHAHKGLKAILAKAALEQAKANG